MCSCCYYWAELVLGYSTITVQSYAFILFDGTSQCRIVCHSIHYQFINRRIKISNVVQQILQITIMQLSKCITTSTLREIQNIALATQYNEQRHTPQPFTQYSITTSQLHCNYFTTTSQLLNNYFKATLQLLHNFFTTISKLFHYYFTTTSRLLHNYFTITSQVLHNYFPTTL